MKLKYFALNSNELETMRRLLEAIGFKTKLERHGNGPEHYSAMFPDGTVLEVYPSKFVSLTKREFRIGLEVPRVDPIIPRITALSLKWQRLRNGAILVHAPECIKFELSEVA